MAEDMVELPRNPVDFEIDHLSDTAKSTLMGWDSNIQRHYNQINPFVQELIDAGFAEHVGGAFAGPGGTQSMWTIKRTFDGWQANERLRCGIYAMHKILYEKRAERDAKAAAEASEMEALPGWGMF